MANKSTDAEIQLRVQTVTAMILQGYSRANIVQYGSKKWKVTERQVDDYISASKAEIKASTDISKEEQIELAKARYNDLYQKNYKSFDFKECRAVQDSLNKMLGLNEAEKHDLNVSGVFEIGYDDEDDNDSEGE
jgi:hypothetical protein